MFITKKLCLNMLIIAFFTSRNINPFVYIPHGIRNADTHSTSSMRHTANDVTLNFLKGHNPSASSVHDFTSKSVVPYLCFFENAVSSIF